MKKILVLLGAVILLASCESKTNSNNEVLATVNGAKITYGDVVKKYPDLDKQVNKLKETIYRYKKAYAKRAAEDKILELEAKKEGISVQDLVSKNISSKMTSVTDADVAKFAKERHFTKEQTEKLKDRIKMFLQKQKEDDLRQAYVNKLKKSYKVKITVKGPEKPKVNVKISDEDPTIGPRSAKVTVVEFSDFQCPFCGRASVPFRKIVKEYKDRVRFVWKNFPLSFHNRARSAALAAMCVNEQGKFWEYHDLLFDHNTELSDDNLIKYAQEVGVKDMKAFKDCYKNKKYDSKINKDIAEGTSYGVSGTPSFFVNGEVHVGALGYQQMKEIIEDALNR